jgi:chromosome partitioning protein
MEKCITFHFYKGGTGKSTISSDISILLVKKDINIILIDMNVYVQLYKRILVKN